MLAKPIASTPDLIRPYIRLTKPKVVMLLVFTAIVGMLLASPSLPSWEIVLFGSLGIGLASGAAAVINHVVDSRIDAVMARTRGRPLPSGDVDAVRALAFGAIIGVAGLGMLWTMVNPLTAILTFISLIGYAVIYTMFLKRATPQNIVIGGAAGAAPPILGWTAVTGDLHAGALQLFLIIFIWTPPHFWALALQRKAEYARAQIPMLPVTHGDEFTRLNILLYTILLVAVTLLPFATGESGLVYLIGACVLNGWFFYHALCLYRSRDNARWAMPTFVASINYLMYLFALLLIDHYVQF